MTQEKLDLTPFEKTLNSLKNALDDYQQELNKHTKQYIRDACIKRFEYCYELSHKMLRRYLASISANPDEVQKYEFQQLIRKGYEAGLLVESWDKWRNYREDRNNTSHAYDEEKAISISLNLNDFYQEAVYLFKQIEQRIKA